MSTQRKPTKKVVTLHLVDASKNDCESVANMLEEWAAMARAGKLRGAVVGALDSDDQPMFAMGGNLRRIPRDAYWLASLLAESVMTRSREV